MPQYGGGTVRGGYDQAQAQALNRRAMDMQNTTQGLSILSTLSQQQAKQQALAQEQAFRAELQALGPNATQEQLAGVAAKYSGPKELLTSQTASMDRKAQIEATKQAREAQMAAAAEKATADRDARLEAAQMRVDGVLEAARQRGADAQTLKSMELSGREHLAKLAASLRAPPQPRNLQLTTDAGGNQLIVNPDGTTRPLTTEDGTGVKKPVAADRPMTEFQGKAALYGTRTAQSDKVLRSLEDNISTTGLAAGQATGVIGNALMSSEQRRVDQAQRDFVNAVLRQESGAVISDAEFANAKKQYFPQPGDDKNTVDQKRANRQLAIQGFARMSGPKGSADIKAVLEVPLLPGVSAISPTPQQAGGKIGGYVETRKTADGRVLGKKADGTIEEIKQ